MPEFKYIMFSVERKPPRLIPVLFPVELTHADVAKALARVPQLRKAVPETAGTITFDVSSCSGDSETLQLRSSALDALVINSYSYTHGLIK